MPRYYFLCPVCDRSDKVIRPAARAKDPLKCTCGNEMKRNPQGASARIVETRDNGIMSKRVEQPADVERLMWERSHKPEDREP